jgi:hypothetical protein
MIKALFLGDIVGKPGRRIVEERLPSLVLDYGVDVVVGNVENIAGGVGVTPETLDKVFGAGVDIATSGNHIFDKKEMAPAMDGYPNLLRPANYPPGTPGQGYTIFPLPKGQRLAVINISGLVFMPDLDCPFRTADRLLDKIADECDAVIVDFHAEATSEKNMMGLYLDGRVGAVIGTHTHVQTADEAILPGGTAYITDVGMCGPTGGVIGTAPDSVRTRFVIKMPARFDVHDGPPMINAVFLTLNEESGKAINIRRIWID